MSGKRINWLIVGLGDVAVHRVLPALAQEPRSRFVGAVTSRARLPGDAVIPRHWLSLKEALAEAEIDAVYVATPPFLHASQTIESLCAGKHVLCEKPASLTVSEAQAMVAAADRSGRRLGIAYFRRCYPKLRRARALIAAGAIGRITKAEAHCSEWRPPGVGPTWMHDAARAGSGPLYDIGSHRVDALNFLLGEPIGVRSERWRSQVTSSVEDFSKITIEYSGGVMAEVTARWDIRGSKDDFSISGTNGKLELGPLNGPGLTGPHGEESLPCAGNRHEPLLQEWVTAVLDGGPMMFSARDCLATAWVLERATAGVPLRQKSYPSEY